MIWQTGKGTLYSHEPSTKRAADYK
jgi:hypothetical protein